MRQTVRVICREGHFDSFQADIPFRQRDWRCDAIDESGKICGLSGRYWDCRDPDSIEFKLRPTERVWRMEWGAMWAAVGVLAAAGLRATKSERQV